MATPKSLAVLTLKTLARECVKEQWHLKMVSSARRKMEKDEEATRERIRLVKARIDRELLASGSLLGLAIGTPDDLENEDE
jgi:hypothetical protein